MSEDTERKQGLDGGEDRYAVEDEEPDVEAHRLELDGGEQRGLELDGGEQRGLSLDGGEQRGLELDGGE